MEKESKFMQGERRRLEQLQKLRLLPHSYRKIGTVVAILALVALFTGKFSAIEFGDFKFILRSLLISGLLLVAISRDKIEDELTLKLRSEAFVITFIFGVIYTIIRPFVDYLVFGILDEGFDPDGLSSFELMLVMLMIQIMFYNLAKKMR